MAPCSIACRWGQQGGAGRAPTAPGVNTRSARRRAGVHSSLVHTAGAGGGGVSQEGRRAHGFRYLLLGRRLGQDTRSSHDPAGLSCGANITCSIAELGR